MTEYNLIRDKLGYLRVDPLPSQDELDKFYAKEFYSDAKPRYIERMEDDWRWWYAVYTDRWEILQGILTEQGFPNDVMPKLLDIGCGGGFFLKAVDTLVFSEGVEPNEQARAYAQELNPWCKLFPTIEYCLDRRYDVINIDMVLEHLINPLEMLQNCHRMLHTGGAICVVVPNEKFIDNGFYERLKYPHVFQPPQHLNYFTFGSIEALMAKAGFEIVEESATFPMELFLDMGLNFVGSEIRGRMCHQIRKMFDMSMASSERRKFYREIAEAGQGREAVIFARKVDK